MTDRITVRAPGRVNLIGEHTDYNGGFVLPVAISLETHIRLTPTGGRQVEITLARRGQGQHEQLDLDAIGPRRNKWIDYVSGVAQALMDAGRGVGGFSGRLTSSLPMSSGLSSSAALELASAWALLAAAGTPAESVDRLELARLCQRAENGYVGVNSGLMDQFASSCGVAGHALLLDCRSLEYRPVPIPAGVEIVVIATGTRRRLLSSEYNERRAQCERGVAVLRSRGEEVSSLRDVDSAMLEAARQDLGDIIYRRCRHVVDENQRTMAAVAALEAGDLHALGELFAASHRSLRDLYEVSSAELDAAVDIACSTPGVIAARMTGAGFGGCSVNLVEATAVASLRGAIEREYKARTGHVATIYTVDAVDGAGYLESAA